MPVHHGRHEMPGWRGYLPESVDRSSRRGSGRRGAAPRHPTSRRVVAAGALTACALAGGAVIHTRSAGPPAAPSAPADDATAALARTSAWTGEATPVLAAIETELRRTDEVRRRWDASARAQRDRPPPGAVVALLERRTELAHHRDALRATMAAISSAPATESALASAWPQLRAAQEMLRALVSARGELGDPVETKVLRLLDQEFSDTSDVPPASGEDKGRATRGGVEDTVTVALAAMTAEPAEPTAASAPVSAEVPQPLDVASGPVTSVVPPTDPVSGAVGEVIRSAGAAEADEAAESFGPDTSGRAAATDPGESDTDAAPQRSTDQVLDPASGRTILTFDRPATDAADSESLGEEVPPASDVPTDDDEEASACQDRLT